MKTTTTTQSTSWNIKAFATSSWDFISLVFTYLRVRVLTTIWCSRFQQQRRQWPKSSRPCSLLSVPHRTSYQPVVAVVEEIRFSTRVHWGLKVYWAVLVFDLQHSSKNSFSGSVIYFFALYSLDSINYVILSYTSLVIATRFLQSQFTSMLHSVNSRYNKGE